jgi:hypothetical protein
MRFLRLVNNWAVFEDFAPLGDTIVAARPHLIVMQLDLLAQERAERARALLLREYVEWLMFGRGRPENLDHGDRSAIGEKTVVQATRRRCGSWLVVAAKRT